MNRRVRSNCKDNFDAVGGDYCDTSTTPIDWPVVCNTELFRNGLLGRVAFSVRRETGYTTNNSAPTVCRTSSQQRGNRDTTTRPSNRMSPTVGSTSPAIIFMVVDLPDPFGPEVSRNPARQGGKADIIDRRNSRKQL